MDMEETTQNNASEIIMDCTSKLSLLEAAAGDMAQTLDGENFGNLSQTCYGFEVICREMKERLKEASLNVGP